MATEVLSPDFQVCQDQLQTRRNADTKQITNRLLKLQGKEIISLLSCQGKERFTLVHRVCRDGVSSDLEFLFDVIRSEFAVQLFTAREDRRNQTPLHYAARNETDRELVLVLLDYIIKTFTEAEFKKLLLVEDVTGRTFLHWATYSRSARMIEGILKRVPLDVTKRLMMVRDAHTCETPLLIAMQTQNDIIRAYLEFLGGNPDVGDKNVFYVQNNAGNNILHLAAQHGSAALMETVVKLLPSDVVAALSVMQNSAGQTPRDITGN